MDDKVKDGYNSYKELLGHLNSINNTKYDDIYKVSTELIVKYPDLIIFNYIEITSYEKRTNLYMKLKKNIIPNFDMDLLVFKTNLYNVFNNSFSNGKYKENDYIMNETEKKINEISKNSYLKKFMNVIAPLIEGYSKEEKIITNLLLLNPLKFIVLKKKLDFKTKINEFYNRAALEKNEKEFLLLASQRKKENLEDKKEENNLDKDKTNNEPKDLNENNTESEKQQ